MQTWLSQGWCEVPRLVTPAEVDSILAAADALFALPPAERRVGDKPHSGTRHLEELDDRIPLVADVVERPPLLERVAALVGPDAERAQTSLRSPNSGFGRQQLHADDVPKLSPGEAAVATAIIALVDMDASNGATVVLPGSHDRPDLQRRGGSLASHPDEVTLAGPAGTAFVFSGHLLHAGGHNSSPHQRPVLQVLWRRTVPGVAKTYGQD